MLDQVDFASAFLKAGYGASGGKIDYEFRKIQDKRTSRHLEKEKMQNSRII